MSDQPFARAGRLDGVERLADGAVAERVEVRLEPEGVEPDDGLLEDLGVDEVDAPVVGPVCRASSK